LTDILRYFGIFDGYFRQVACSWNVNAPNCLKLLLKLDATVLGPRSPTMHAVTIAIKV